MIDEFILFVYIGIFRYIVNHIFIYVNNKTGIETLVAFLS